MKRRAFLAMTATLLCAFSGCLSAGEYVPATYYAIAPEIVVEPEAQPREQTIGVRPIAEGAAYGPTILYRQQGYALTAYEQAEWAEAPGAVVTHAIVVALREMNGFANVGYAAELQTPDIYVTGRLLAFEEVRSEAGRTAAVAVEVAVRDALTDKTFFSGIVRAETPLKDETRLALAEAMSASVAEIAGHIANAVRP